MFDFFTQLFDTSGFPPRWRCGTWTAAHGWLHILSDLGVWSAYVAIPCVLVYFLLRRKDLPFRMIFLLFGAFILACGTTHLMEAILFWWPAYRLAGVIKLGTAVVSWATVIALIPVTPKVLAMPSPKELEREIDARKKAEDALQRANAELAMQVKALRASEEQFRLLVEGTKDQALFLLDSSGRIASWNLGAERLKQYRAAEIVGQHFSRFYRAADVQAGKPDRELRLAAADGRHEEEGWRVRKDGTQFWANVVVTALRDETGSLRGFSKITRDITTKQQAEENARRLVQEEGARRAAEEHAETIREQRERLRVTLHSIGDGVITTDAEGRVTLLNPVAQALTGWGAEASGKPLEEVFIIVNEQTRKTVENPVSRVLREDRVVGLANHTLLIAKDGAEKPIDDSAAPIRSEKGSMTGVVLVFRDVTERRRAEEALRTATEQLRIVTDSMAAPVTRCGKDLRYLWVSKSYAEWINQPEAEIVGRPIIDVIGAEAFASLRSHFQRVLSGEQVKYETVVNFRGIGPRWVNTTYTPTLNAAGTPDGWVAVVIDITNRKRLEQELKEADHRKDEFLAMLAHELRNPLAPIRNALQIMHLAEGNPETTVQARSLMERQVQQLVRLVDDLLDVSRISSGKIVLRKERTTLAAVVRHALETCRPMMEAAGQHLTISLPPEPLSLDADLTRLAQVLCNLLHNASKYTEKGGQIWLTGERQDGTVVLKIKDTGIGIPADMLTHIFKMFTQVEHALERAQGGLGIGLTLVQRLVEMHGGTVEAQSPGPGQGSEFIVRLPAWKDDGGRMKDEKEEGAASALLLPPSSLPKCRILVADDNTDSADSLAMMLTLLGNEVRTVYDGLAAVEAAEAFQPDIILLDIGMPKIDGYEAARRIRRSGRGKDIVLAALTGWGQEEDRQLSKEAGFDVHLVKPVEQAALEKLLKRCPEPLP